MAALDVLTEDRIEERTAILWGVDAQTCQRCGRSALDVGAASDPAWFIDTEAQRDEAGEIVRDASDEPISLAVIFCPTCW